MGDVMSGVTAKQWIMDSLPHAKQLDNSSPTKRMYQTDAMIICVFPSAEAERGKAETEIASSQAHACIVPTLMILSASDGLIVVYPKVDGYLLSDPDVLHAFETIDLATRAKLVGDILDTYAAVSELGYVLVDIYLGNIMLDFSTLKIWCFDWDLCQPGTGFTLETENNYGSNRLQAPEEHVQGAWIDARTNVYNLGKIIHILLPDGGEDVMEVVEHATQDSQDDRYPTVQLLADHYRTAAGLPPAHGVIVVDSGE